MWNYLKTATENETEQQLNTDRSFYFELFYEVTEFYLSFALFDSLGSSLSVLTRFVLTATKIHS